MNSQKSFVSNLQQAAHDNPLAAGLIGLGAIWLLSGRLKTIASVREAGQRATEASQAVAESVSRLGGRVAGASDRVTSRVGETMSAAKEEGRRGATTVAARLGEAGDATANATQEAVQQAAERFTDALGGVKQSLYSSGQSTYSRLQGLLEEQPLAIGAIGLGLGLAVAASLPMTTTEADRLRPVADIMKRRLDEGAESVKARTERALEAAREEAKRQGLDPQHMGEQLRDKANELSDAIRESVREHTT